MNTALRLAEALIACRSVTPDDAGCQRLVAERLGAAGFACESLDAGDAAARVTNLWALHRGPRPGPTLVLAGHTDVVPPGPMDREPRPFVPTHRDFRFRPRRADMTAIGYGRRLRTFVAVAADHAQRCLCCSQRTSKPGCMQPRSARMIARRDVDPSLSSTDDSAAVGAPSRSRADLSLRLVFNGVQGPVPIRVARTLSSAGARCGCVHSWEPATPFPPTSFQVSNVTPCTVAGMSFRLMLCHANFRFGPRRRGVSPSCVAVCNAMASTIASTYLGGEPFLRRRHVCTPRWPGRSNTSR